ncbi:hypothetical protein KN10_2120 [Anoxybacillus flavithermus NBRC 109594]|uniref:Uncharacterized protein n=1 Tax=Anoxybacillus flavithermus NBRC 109594 TaxID=1315967 RepID=R4G1N3_9BACL|nr:hypothetical protein KN10_2120 [Anoxybacillus flavithermus NBRC 109594]
MNEKTEPYRLMKAFSKKFFGIAFFVDMYGCIAVFKLL